MKYLARTHLSVELAVYLSAAMINFVAFIEFM